MAKRKTPGQRSAAAAKRSGTRTGSSTAARRKAAPTKSAARRSVKPSGRATQAGKLQDVTAEVRRRYAATDDHVPTPPSSLDLDRHASAARSGRAQSAQRRAKQTAALPEISAGDVDADWMGGYFVGDEAPAGDNPTPDQDSVEEVGRAVGVDYQDNEELRSTDKISKRDRKRWELDPASSEDYPERNRKKER